MVCVDSLKYYYNILIREEFLNRFEGCYCVKQTNYPYSIWWFNNYEAHFMIEHKNTFTLYSHIFQTDIEIIKHITKKEEIC